MRIGGAPAGNIRERRQKARIDVGAPGAHRGGVACEPLLDRRVVGHGVRVGQPVGEQAHLPSDELIGGERRHSAARVRLCGVLVLGVAGRLVRRYQCNLRPAELPRVAAQHGTPRPAHQIVGDAPRRIEPTFIAREVVV